MTQSDATETGIATKAARICSDVLENVYLELKALPPPWDRKGIGEALKGALTCLGALKQSTLDQPSYLTLLDNSIEALHKVTQALAAIEENELGRKLLADAKGAEDALQSCRAQAIDEVVERQAEASAPTERRPLFVRTGASVGVPGLYMMADQKFSALVDVRYTGHRGSDEGELAETVDEVESELVIQVIEHGSTADGSKPLEMRVEVESLARIAWACLDDIARLSHHCRGHGMDPYIRQIPSFEQRMLNSLDALMSMAYRADSPQLSEGRGDVPFLDVVHLTQTYVTAMPELMADGVFVRAFVLGCIAGEAAIQAAMLALRQTEGAAKNMALLLSRQREALILGSSPLIAPAMRRLCMDSSARLTRLALDVLRQRGEVLVADVAALTSHPDTGVREAVARALGWAAEKELAGSMLTQMLRGDEDDRVFCAAVESMIGLGMADGREYARVALQNELDSPGMLSPRGRLDLLDCLAISGESADLEILRRCFDEDPREAGALGWFGRPDGVDLLLDALEKADKPSPLVATTELLQKPSFGVAVANALHRITGFGHSTWELTEAPELLEGHLDASRWRDRWSSKRQAFQGSKKYRWGRVYEATASLEELEAKGAIGTDRDKCALEVAAATKGSKRIRLGGWTAWQGADIEAAREYLQGGG